MKAIAIYLHFTMTLIRKNTRGNVCKEDYGENTGRLRETNCIPTFIRCSRMRFALPLQCCIKYLKKTFKNDEQ